MMQKVENRRLFRGNYDLLLASIRIARPERTLTLKFRWKRGHAIVALLCVALMLFVAACGGDDDDSDNGDTTPTSNAATSTTGSSGSDTTPTAGDDASATGTGSSSGSATATGSGSDGSATTTGSSGSDGTATETESNPESTGTGTSGSTPSTSDPTATSGSNTSPTQPSGSASPTSGTGLEVPDIETLDPELLPNFSMRMDFDATNYAGSAQTTMVIEMRQSEIGTYYMRMETDGEALEFWTIGDKSWTSVGGQIIESPGGSMFNPADILATGQVMPEGLNARKDGEEEINGRQTTRWVTDGADYVALMNEEALAQGTTTVEMTDGAGEVVVWIDNELDIMIRAEGDVTWTNSDSTEGSLVYQYEIHDIGSTEEITQPQ